MAPTDTNTDEKVRWNGWPDGDFERDLSWDEFKQTNCLQVHWSYRVGGGDRKGDEMGDTWEEGKKGI